MYLCRCGPCQVIAPKIEELEANYASNANVKFFKVDVDKAPGLAKTAGVTAMPTFVIMKDGVTRHTIVGADLNRITNAISGLAQEGAKPVAASSS